MNPVLLDAARHDLSYEPTITRPTPRTGMAFSEVVGRSAASLVQEAGSAVQQLPGGPMLAAALRSGSAITPGSSLGRPPSGAVATPNVSAGRSAAGLTPAGASASAAEGPGASVGDGTQSIDGTLQNSQDMNLYYLQLQEAMAAENRSYTACSNVLKARHDTVKNAIGNIR